MFHTEHNISRVLGTSIEEFMSMIFPIDKLFIRYYCMHVYALKEGN